MVGKCSLIIKEMKIQVRDHIFTFSSIRWHKLMSDDTKH